MLGRIKSNQDFRRLIQTVRERITDAEIGISSSAIAYYLLLSIFPLIIAIGNILPFLNIDIETLLNYIAMIIPADVFKMLEGTIRSLLENSYGSLLSLSALATLWAASRSINALQRSLNKVYGVGGSRNMIVTRMVSFIVIFLFLFGVVLLTTLFTVGQSIFDALMPNFPFLKGLAETFSAVRWPAILFGIFATMFVIYYFLPNAKIHVRYILPGTFFTTVGWMVLTQVFGYYAKYFAGSFSSYGIIGSFIIVMLWFNFAATLIIAGGIVNAVTEEYFCGTIVERNLSLDYIRGKLKEKTEKN
ncbi:YihY/virulence factor BrkB family protein [Vagococcus elongatus]|uniref:Ribonuclease BN n=1 Tax=Vagococcus elongatus TaxID=180344 RepID=A0A430B435_9ENTE|nr:YihY/virulence factor BrkB family protein [Vagococcus elongatus]RSU15084.1 ribonuclease BN [Vagococcus elongatus]